MKTKILKCCVGCNGLKNGMCCCSLPDSCDEYVEVDLDDYGNIKYTNTTEQIVGLQNKEIYELQNEQLKQQLAEKDKEIERLKEDYEHCNNLRKLEIEINNNYRTEKYGLDKPVEELRKIKLSIPEKEWYYKGFDNCERQFATHIADLTLQIKKLKNDTNQKAIEELEKLKDYCNTSLYVGNGFSKEISLGDVKHWLWQRIKELKGDKNETNNR